MSNRHYIRKAKVREYVVAEKEVTLNYAVWIKNPCKQFIGLETKTKNISFS